MPPRHLRVLGGRHSSENKLPKNLKNSEQLFSVQKLAEGAIEGLSGEVTEQNQFCL